MKIIFILFALVSCTSFLDEEHLYIDQRLRGNVDVFFNEAKSRNIELSTNCLSIVIGKIDTAGLTHFADGCCTVTINEEFYSHGKPDSLAMQYILFHEMGHYMGRDHNNKFSIMNPNTYAGEYHNSTEKRRLLINELFE